MTLSSTEVKDQLTLFEFTPGRSTSWAVLKRLLPDVNTALFFARAFDMNYEKLSTLIFTLFDTKLLNALKAGDHSVSLQDYIIDVVPAPVWQSVGAKFNGAAAPKGEFLPELWDAIDIVIAKSIKDVAAQLAGVLDALPGKEGEMTFQHMARLNRQRPTIGVYGARIAHKPTSKNLVIVDDSGSMGEHTIRALAEDAVALGFKAQATFALVSSTTRVWEPGNYSVQDILSKAEYGGTQYETLGELLDEDWGVVTTIADYDSSMGAKQSIASRKGRIKKVIDLSLVNRPTFLAECVGQLADEVEPMLIATSYYPVV